jgi:hypothetical protein
MDISVKILYFHRPVAAVIPIYPAVPRRVYDFPNPSLLIIPIPGGIAISIGDPLRLAQFII